MELRGGQRAKKVFVVDGSNVLLFSSKLRLPSPASEANKFTIFIMNLHSSLVSSCPKPPRTTHKSRHKKRLFLARVRRSYCCCWLIPFRRSARIQKRHKRRRWNTLGLVINDKTTFTTFICDFVVVFLYFHFISRSPFFLCFSLRLLVVFQL